MSPARKLPKPTPAELRALLQYRENLEGGDPDMSRVTTATCLSLLRKRLVAACYYDEPNSDELRWREGRDRVFARNMIPTRLGLAVLDSLTYGPRE